MKSLKTKKVQMTQIFDDRGMVIPATILQSGEEIGNTFVEGEVVSVTGTSKGKGFQGVVKRHGFHGGPRSHGQKHSEREPGSLGGGGRDGGRVAKGKRMGGRMGGETITVLNLKVVKILPESKEILVSGAIPGRRGSIVMIKVK